MNLSRAVRVSPLLARGDFGGAGDFCCGRPPGSCRGVARRSGKERLSLVSFTAGTVQENSSSHEGEIVAKMSVDDTGGRAFRSRSPVKAFGGPRVPLNTTQVYDQCDSGHTPSKRVMLKSKDCLPCLRGCPRRGHAPVALLRAPLTESIQAPHMPPAQRKPNFGTAGKNKNERVHSSQASPKRPVCRDLGLSDANLSKKQQRALRRGAGRPRWWRHSTSPWAPPHGSTPLSLNRFTYLAEGQASGRDRTRSISPWETSEQRRPSIAVRAHISQHRSTTDFALDALPPLVASRPVSNAPDAEI